MCLKVLVIRQGYWVWFMRLPLVIAPRRLLFWLRDACNHGFESQTIIALVLLEKDDSAKDRRGRHARSIRIPSRLETLGGR